MKKVFRKIYSLISKPDLKVLPGNIAFYLVLSIIPIIALIGFIASNFNVPIDNLTNFMNTYFPKEVSVILIPFFSGQGVNLNVIVFTFMGFYLASNGTDAIIISSNRLYGLDDNIYIKRKLKSLNLILLLVLLIVFMLVFMAFGNNIMNFLTENFFQGYEKYAYYLYLFIKWPIGLIFIFLVVKLIYTIAPDESIPSRCVNKGAIFTTILWLVVTYIYGYYVTNIANYTVFYGNLSNIVILMFWIYFISYILVLGIVINVVSYDIKNKGNNSNI